MKQIRTLGGVALLAALLAGCTDTSASGKEPPPQPVYVITKFGPDGSAQSSHRASIYYWNERGCVHFKGVGNPSHWGWHFVCTQTGSIEVHPETPAVGQ